MRKSTALSLAALLLAVPAAASAQMSSGSSSPAQSTPQTQMNNQSSMPGSTSNNGMNNPSGTSSSMTRDRATQTKYNQKQHCMLSGNTTTPMQASKSNSAAANHCPPGTKPAPQ